MRKIVFLCAIAIMPLLSAGCMRNCQFAQFYYDPTDHALFILNFKPYSNVARLKLNLRGDTLELTKASLRWCYPPAVRYSMKNVAYNNVKVMLPKDVKWYKYMNEPQELREMQGVGNMVGMRRMCPFILEVSPRKYPYVLK